MPTNKKKNKKYDMDNEIIIGYNTKKKTDNPPKKENKKKKARSKIKKEDTQVIKKKRKKKKKKNNKLKKILGLFFKLLVVIGIAIAIILFLFVSPIFNIQEVIIEGSNEINESVYMAMTGLEIGQNIFEIDKIGIQTTILKEPYVEAVEIKSVYPNKVEIHITERTASYIAEENGRYFSLDKNGYVLETNISALELLQIKGLRTKLEAVEVGERIQEEDLVRLDDMIKIMDAIQNNDIQAKLTSVDITDSHNYILEFTEEKKKVMIGDSSDLSAKMAWINLFMSEKQNERGTIYLNAKDVYFAPDAES